MARFIIRFYSSDNVLRKEVSVIGRKLSNREVAKMNVKDFAESNEDSMLKLFRKCQPVFQSVCTNLPISNI